MSMSSTKDVNTALRVISVWITITGCMGAANPLCQGLQQSTNKQKLDYLRGDRSALDPACVMYAIQQLGIEHNAASADVLATYLDFEGPKKGSPDDVVAIVRLPWLGDKYPAADSLFEIGKPA